MEEEADKKRDNEEIEEWHNKVKKWQCQNKHWVRSKIVTFIWMKKNHLWRGGGMILDRNHTQIL
jgi:hypothetical protein